MMKTYMSILAKYLAEIRTIRDLGAGVAETSYYPPLANLFNSVGHKLKPKVVCVIHLQNTGAGIPEAGFFTASQVQRSTGTIIPGQKPSRGALEAKAFNADMDELAHSEQVLRYLNHYNQVLITNLREFRLLVLENGFSRKVEEYKLSGSKNALFHSSTLKDHSELFPEFLERVLRRQSSITDPADLAWFLASYAREARWRAENHGLSSFDTIKRALEESLGIKFEGEKGRHFFRSTLVQTLFYGIFSAWVLWCRTEGKNAAARFDWRTSTYYLHVPVLRKLFNEISDPGPLDAIQITEMLDLAGDTIARVDRPTFFSKFSQADAVQYFYEPFLEAFDPRLRKDLGVWYTPREIVQYMVERVDHLVRTELSQPLGLASSDVCILDPCCGTGAYLTAVLDRIHRTLLAVAGDDAALVPDRVRTAALTRIFGFEILPAPFVIAHMQLAAELSTLGAPLNDNERAGVFLTNALTGWVPEQEPKKSIFPDLQKEKEDAEAVKRRPTILVILGNPPYNGYSGIAKIEEERDLTNAYRDPIPGVKAPEGHGLNELYVRFFRAAERRISRNEEGQGIVCFISNYSWLDGLSHPSMRYHYLQTFHDLYIDNLHGDRKISEYAPDGRTSETVFSVAGTSVGIKVGIAIATLVRNTSANGDGATYYRDFDEARADERRRSLLNSLANDSNAYQLLVPNPVLGLPFKPTSFTTNYLDWPLFPALIPESSPGIQTGRDDLLVGLSREQVKVKLERYLDANVPHDVINAEIPGTMDDTDRFPAVATRESLQRRGFREWQIVPFAYRPYDCRWLYWEPTTKLLDEKREEYHKQYRPDVPAIYLAQKNRRAFDPPGLTYQLGNRHLNERGANIFPLSTTGEPLPGHIESRPNLTYAASMYATNANADPSHIFFHALSTMHTPKYISGNSGALMSDWPRIPLPANAHLLARSADLGRQLAELLDAESEARLLSDWYFLGRLVLPKPPNLGENLKLTAGWGHHGRGGTVNPGRGDIRPRPWSETELERLSTLAFLHSISIDQVVALLGESCLDVHLNGAALWTAVPVAVWDYTLGGYQVLKKWLSYRELSILGRPLLSDESDYFAQVVRRITAILLLGPALDASYQAIVPTAIDLPPS
jgi:hypothetical protein